MSLIRFLFLPLCSQGTITSMTNTPGSQHASTRSEKTHDPRQLGAHGSSSKPERRDLMGQDSRLCVFCVLCVSIPGSCPTEITKLRRKTQRHRDHREEAGSVSSHYPSRLRAFACLGTDTHGGTKVIQFTNANFAHNPNVLTAQA